ncbi:helix-turn-helix domain-containing protein [Rhodobacteraceae bacterium LMO-12]|nr:helix-turn-helix domain-containing protein [Rhodobacteraceae bacterium LMO-JJ12]
MSLDLLACMGDKWSTDHLISCKGESMQTILGKTINNTFSASELSELTGAKPDSIQNWLKRDLIIGHKKITGGGGQGKHRRFTFHNMIEVAMAQTLINLHMGSKEAFAASANFAHAGGGGTTFNMPKRDPGLPFHFNHGETIFGVAGGWTFEELWKPGSSRDTYGNLRQHLHADHFLTVNASEVFNLVCARMDVHPYKVLDAAYPEDAS